MVDSIKSTDGKIIIVTKPKAKPAEKTKDGDFGKMVEEKSDAEGAENITNTSKSSPLRSPEMNPMLHDKHANLRMQKLEEIARQIKDGTYKLVDPAVLADRIFKAAFNPQARAGILKKFIADELEQMKSKNRSTMSKLELKRLVMMSKESPEEVFNDPELEEMLRQLT
ncbi:MAG: flagellar biosynthesis anti-sigma factor FlgM [Candidatus Riflebacteria bacterium]|nr:flagellar biosynthesis anti-sigma factor FlgM [Candidatus Riflebacteria bacterium]